MKRYHEKKQIIEFIYGIIAYEQKHFVFVVIDIFNRSVSTLDPFQTELDKKHILARKWISKIISIIMYLVYNTPLNHTLSYNYESTDMISDKFTKEQDTKNFWRTTK